MSHQIPNELRYTKDHEWVKIEGETATIGITDFAQSSLGDIVFVELPDEGRALSAGDAFGVVESIKSVSDLYSPVTGDVIEKSADLEANPDQCNQAPYDSWMIKVTIVNSDEVAGLMSSDEYTAHCASLE